MHGAADRARSFPGAPSPGALAPGALAPGASARTRRPWKRTRTVATLVIAVGLIAAGCGSSKSKSSSNTTTPSQNTAPAKYPAPSGGNGGATATGVTANSINLALVYSITGPAPGVTLGARYGAQAYVNYINSEGGIYGRQLHLTAYDDGFDPTKAKADCTQIAPKYFAITGGFSVGDAGCYQTVQSSGIPWIQFYYDNQSQTLPNVYFADGGSVNEEPTGSYYGLKSLFPNVTKVAALYEETPVTGSKRTTLNPACFSPTLMWACSCEFL